MRNIHDLIGTEFGRESVTIFRRWEQLEKKITDYCNHRGFTLRCLGQKVTPVSLRLSKNKSNIKTPRGIKIIQRAEKQLMDERVRSIKNTTNVCMKLKYTCMNDLKDLINDDLCEKCHAFIRKIREHRHKTIQER